jgi:uncharacterized protein YodC (DUF2158 family)
MSNAFQVGDVVRLKSGGPDMTVQSIDSDGLYCTWFDDKKQRQFDTFNPAIVEKTGSGWGIA